MGRTAAVAGASGYTGGELLRLLLGHPDFQLGALAAGESSGRAVTDLHPHLPALADRWFTEPDPAALAADVVFLALPHGRSAELAARLPADTVLVDLSADHRLADPADWARWYGGGHAGRWTYGLPELPDRRGEVRDARRIANPGCYPTAAGLALAPLLAAGLVQPADVVVVAASGTTGAGRGTLSASEVLADLSAYRPAGAHQHTPELTQLLSEAAGRQVSVSFTPVLAPLPRGILATCTARLTDGVGTVELRAALRGSYRDEPFVRVLADDVWPHTGATVGSNCCQLQAAADLGTGRAVVVAALDNLGKGAAGQAVQNANLALGLPETAGLTGHGLGR